MTTTTATRTFFYGFGAYVGTITGPTTCSWWPDDPVTLQWDPSMLVPVDLAKNVSAVRNYQIKLDDLQVDDHRADGGLTAIGPRWPGGQTIAPCWVAAPYWKSLQKNQPARHPATAPDEAHDYELTSLLYWDGDLAGRRFHGFHAKIIGTNGGLARCEIWHAGTSRIKGQPPAGEWWLDLAADAHPVEPGVTQISIGGVQEGALFLGAMPSSTMMLRSAKRPAIGGSDLYPLPMPAR